MARWVDERENTAAREVTFTAENSMWDRELLDGITGTWIGEPVQDRVSYVYGPDGQVIGGTF